MKRIVTAEEVQELIRKAYLLNGEGQERMLRNGWHIVVLSLFDSYEKTAEKLSGFEKVKIYESTTRVRGLHDIFGMVK